MHLNRIILVAYAASLFILSVGSPGRLTVRVVTSLPGRNVAAHLLTYAVLAVLLCRALRGAGRTRGAKAAFQAFLLAVLYGAVIEGFQWLSVSRNASLADIGYNAVGAFAGCALWACASRWLRRVPPDAPAAEDQGHLSSAPQTNGLDGAGEVS